MIKINGVTSNKQYIGNQPVFNYKKGYDYSVPFYVENITQSQENINFQRPDAVPYFDIEISTDAVNWSTLQSVQSGPWHICGIGLQPGDKVYVRATTDTWADQNNTDNHGSISGMSKVGGNIMSLLFGSGFTGNERAFASDTRGNFEGLFEYVESLVDASELLLPANIIPHMCYRLMFSNCTNLINSPVLTDVLGGSGEYGLSETFAGCTSLVTPPVFNKNLNMANVGHMFHVCFRGCTSLVTPPALPMTSLGQGCYNAMFQDCSSLATAPELPATTLASYCYNEMFSGCYSLTTAPELPATTLAQNCYSYMFYGCGSLASSPVLPATTLAENCYEAMFYACGALELITCLATDISANNCTMGWVGAVASDGTFTKNASMSSWGSGDDGIPSGWTVVDA